MVFTDRGVNMKKYLVTIKGLTRFLGEEFIAQNSDEAKRKFCKKRGIRIDFSKLLAERVED